MRLRYAMPLLLVSFAAWAFSPEELLTARQIEAKCEAGVCQVAERDLEWITGRDALLTLIVKKVSGQLHECMRGRSA